MCLNDTNMHMTFVSKQCAQYQCSNNINRWITFMCIPHKPMKNKFHAIIIAKTWPIKFVMHAHWTKWMHWSLQGVSMVWCTQKGVIIWQFSLQHIFIVPFEIYGRYFMIELCN